jgi:hypothetical protein
LILHLCQRIVLGVEARLSAVGIRRVLLALRQDLIEIVDGTGGRRILCGRRIRQARRDVVLRLGNTRFQRIERAEKLRLLEILGYAHA